MSAPLTTLARQGRSLPILDEQQTRHIERVAATHGLDPQTLMRRAGRATADLARHLLNTTLSTTADERPWILVLAGPGNNGGDGLVAAQYLHQEGYAVRVAATVATNIAASGAHPDAWRGETHALGDALSWVSADNAPSLVIDALFGIGLRRALSAEAAALAGATRGLPTLAVDVPSGLYGDGARPTGEHFTAMVTLAFIGVKRCHVLLTARDLCGEVWLDTLGVPEAAFADIAPVIGINSPAFWGDALRARTRRVAGSHKYDFGHLLVALGDFAGAGILAGCAGLRVGAGLVTLAGAEGVAGEVLGVLPSLMFRGTGGDSAALIMELLHGDRRICALVLGSGWRGDSAEVAALTLAVLNDEELSRGLSVVLDAGSLTAFGGEGGVLFAALRGHVSRGGSAVLTPHEGEYGRLVIGTEVEADGGENVESDGVALWGSRLLRAGALARVSGAVVVLKGSDCVVASPDGRALVSVGLVPWLATAGTGDVLSGIIGGLLAQGLDGFMSAGGGVWLHGEAGRRLGPHLVSDELEGELGGIMGIL
ncbi:MAG: NAD(P)H-hydrate epimerase [Alphaproteobacteria bacterium]